MCVGKYGIIPKMDLTRLKQSHDPVSHATVAELPNATKRPRTVMHVHALVESHG